MAGNMAVKLVNMAGNTAVNMVVMLVNIAGNMAVNMDVVMVNMAVHMAVMVVNMAVNMLANMAPLLYLGLHSAYVCESPCLRGTGPHWLRGLRTLHGCRT